MGAIVDIQFGRLSKLLEDRKIVLEPDARARDWLAQRGYDPAYGARPLKRVFQKELQDAWPNACSLAQSRRRACRGFGGCGGFDARRQARENGTRG